MRGRTSDSNPRTRVINTTVRHRCTVVEALFRKRDRRQHHNQQATRGIALLTPTENMAPQPAPNNWNRENYLTLQTSRSFADDNDANSIDTPDKAAIGMTRSISGNALSSYFSMQEMLSEVQVTEANAMRVCLYLGLLCTISGNKKDSHLVLL